MELKYGSVINLNGEKFSVIYVEDNYAIIKLVGSKDEDAAVLLVQFKGNKLSLVKDKEVLKKFLTNMFMKAFND